MKRIVLFLLAALALASTPSAESASIGFSVPIRLSCGASDRYSNCRATAAPNRFVYALTTIFDQHLDTLAAQTNIDGIAMQVGWADLQASSFSSCSSLQSAGGSAGYYCWDPIDAALATIFQAGTGHRATLHILASPQSVSNVLPGLGAQYVSGQVVPWDSHYIAVFSNFLTALSAHLVTLQGLGNHSSVFAVSQTVPVGEMNIIGCLNGNFYGGNAQPPNTGGPSIPYDNTAYLNAWETMSSAYSSAFGSTGQAVFISAPTQGQICGGTADYTFYPSVITNARTLGKSFWKFAADLDDKLFNGIGSQRMSDYFPGGSGTDLSNTLPLAFQMLCHSTADSSSSCPTLGGTYPTNLKLAVCNAMAAGATYIEIYKADVLNSDSTIQAAISAVHTPTNCN